MSAAPTTAVDRFKALIFAKGGKNGLRTLTRIFQTMDSSVRSASCRRYFTSVVNAPYFQQGDRKLDHDELKYGLQDYGLTLSEADLKEVISAVDVHHGGKIDFEEFIEFLRGDLSDRRKALILQAFGCIDTDGSGVATLDEIRAKASLELIRLK